MNYKKGDSMQKSEILQIIDSISINDIEIEILAPILQIQHFKNKYSEESMTILYRNVGENELLRLLSGETIYGKYDLSKERQASENFTNVVCTYTDKIIWDIPNSNRHQYLLELKVPTKWITKKGIGTYYASKKFAETKIWTGRRGTVEYKINEVYLDSYDIGSVINIQKIGQSNYESEIDNTLQYLNYINSKIK